jgi:hypothetical protein
MYMAYGHPTVFGTSCVGHCDFLCFNAGDHPEMVGVLKTSTHLDPSSTHQK